MYKCNQTNERNHITHCRLCFAPIHQHLTLQRYLMSSPLLCGDCFALLHFVNVQVKLDHCRMHILYEYNEFLETMLFQFKEGRDIALAPVFFHDVMNQLFKKYRHYVIVRLPSGKEKTMERGFEPLQEMLATCKLQQIDPFYKISNHKQSLQSYENRKNITQVIKRKPNMQLPNKKLLVVDDVCTSGATLTHALHLLQGHKKNIEILTLSAHPLFLQECKKSNFYKKGIFTNCS